MIAAFIFPFLYCMLIGWAWSKTFHRRFSESLAPAICAQVILTLICGITIQNLLVSIFLGILIALFAVGKSIYPLIKTDGVKVFQLEFKRLWHSGLFLFTVFYIFCFIINAGKRFYSWDEASHWGMFLKECLSNNRLYCTSTLEFYHKDYVPAITLFEYVWSKLCFRFLEADAYRSIQVFMFAMLLPLFTSFEKYATSQLKKLGKSVQNIFLAKLPMIAAFVLVLLVPLIFDTTAAFYFYHSIYCDFAVGILTFYCMLIAYKEYDNWNYRILILTLGLTVLVLSKMTMMAMLPLILAFFLVKQLLLSEQKITRNQALSSILLVAVPIVLWFLFNKFVDIYVPNTGGQSFDGLNISSIFDVFFGSASGSIPYVEQVRSAYSSALFTRNILLNGSYVFALVAVVAIICVLGYFQEGRLQKKIYLSALWVFLSGIGYAILMYFLYCTMFSEYEALILASYERYMNTFIVPALLLALYIFFSTYTWIRFKKSLYICVGVVAAYLLVFHNDAFTQVLPGYLTDDNSKVAYLQAAADDINSGTPEDSSTYIVTRGDSVGSMIYHRFYCAPRYIDGASVGPGTFEGDIWNLDFSVEGFIQTVLDYDYLYLNVVDTVFIEKYGVAFENSSMIANGALYKILGTENGKLKLEAMSVESSASGNPTNSNNVPVVPTNALQKINVFEEYLTALADGDYTIFMSIMDEGTRYVTEDRQALISQLGVQTNLQQHSRLSFYAVIENGTVIAEDSGETLLTHSGTLQNGVSYSISSAGFDYGCVSSIMIDGVEYSKNSRGINFVVYDQSTGQVLDSIVFDLFEDAIPSR